MLNVSDIYCNQLSRFSHLLTTERSNKAPSYLIPTTSRPLVSLVESRSFTQINLLGNSTYDIWDVRVRAHLQTLPPCSLLGNHCDHTKRIHGARTSSIPSQSGLSLPSYFDTMSEYIKSILADLPRKLPSLQPVSAYRPNLSDIQLPIATFLGKSNLPTRSSRAFIALAILLLLLFWKDIIQDVFLHVSTRRLPVPLVKVSPIRNDTLGVGLPEHLRLPYLANSKSSFKTSSSSLYQNAVTEEHLSSLPQTQQTLHSPYSMLYETDKFPSRIGLRYVHAMLLRVPDC